MSNARFLPASVPNRSPSPAASPQGPGPGVMNYSWDFHPESVTPSWNASCRFPNSVVPRFSRHQSHTSCV